MNVIVRMLKALSRPFRLGHIYGQDGSLYMERFALFQTKYLSARLHHIVREDRDRHLHDHPWDFTSVVLQGGYQEFTPFRESGEPVWSLGSSEDEVCFGCWRLAGSIGRRRALDRHKIAQVLPDTWTLFITGPYKNQWGFYTRNGKIPYREYLGLPPKDVVEHLVDVHSTQ